VDKYKSKSVTLRNDTHSKLYRLSKILAPGFDISIPNTIDKMVNERLSGSQDAQTNGAATNDKRHQKA